MRASVGNIIGGERVVRVTKSFAITAKGRRFERRIIHNKFKIGDTVCKEYGRIKWEKWEQKIA